MCYNQTSVGGGLILVVDLKPVSRIAGAKRAKA